MRTSPARTLVIAAIALVAVAAVAGALIGSSSGSASGHAESLGARASVGSIELAYPTSWRRQDTSPAVPGLRIAGPIRLAASTDGSTGVVAGQVAATGPTLLPQSFLARLPSHKPVATAVKLGDHAAFRYRALTPRGSTGPVTAYTVPTSKGVATIACTSGPRAPSSFASRCDAVATSLILHGVTTYPLGADPRYTRPLRSAIATLNARRRAAGTRLHAAKTPAAQARAAAALAGAYGAVHTKLAGISPGPAAADLHAALVNATADAATGYSALAAAARRHSKPGYAKARSAIASSERAVGAQLAALRARGY
jgi:hypothetical protein